MKLYYATGACSLADRIALHEAGLAAAFERVDLKARRTETGADYSAINPKGYVPMLVLDSGETVTENIAILFWITGQAPKLAPAGPLGTTRLLEALAFISTELHHGFKPFFHDTNDAEKAKAADATFRRLDLIAATLKGPYLLGSFSVADAYLFVILTWARKLGLRIPVPLTQFFERMMARESVRRALTEEGLIQSVSKPKELQTA
jgi:glutathione S-transferase